jgi:hypothetical protein
MTMMMRTMMSSYDSQFSNDERMNPRKKKENYYNRESKTSKKITVVLYKNEIHLMGAPKGFEVVVLNLDKGVLIDDDDTYGDE